MSSELNQCAGESRRRISSRKATSSTRSRGFLSTDDQVIQAWLGWLSRNFADNSSAQRFAGLMSARDIEPHVGSRYACKLSAPNRKKFSARLAGSGKFDIERPDVI